MKTAWPLRGSSLTVRLAHPKAEVCRDRDIAFFCVEKSNATTYRGRNGVQQSGCRASGKRVTEYTVARPRVRGGPNLVYGAGFWGGTGSHRQSSRALRRWLDNGWAL